MSDQNQLQQALQAQTNSINRLSEAIEQNNHLLIQVLNANSVLIESLLADEYAEDQGPTTYLDGQPIKQ